MNRVSGSLPSPRTSRLLSSPIGRAQRLYLLLFTAAISLLPLAHSQQMKVRHRAGSAHGFLVLHNEGGSVIASGELTQMPVGDRMKVHVVFHFKDGSLHDETTIYSQRKIFRLISYHIIQRGDSFPNPCDITIDAHRQQLSIRAMDNGKEVVKNEHMDFPADLSDGIAFTLIENLETTDPRMEVPYLAVSAKPRMVKLAIEQEGEEPFTVAGRNYKAMKYAIKVNLGGLTGIVAPLIGKQPEDMHVWVSESAVPAILRVDSSLYTEGPTWSIELASPTW